MTSEERAALRKMHAASTRGEWHYVAQPDPAGGDFYGVATDWDAEPADITDRGLFVAGCLVGPAMTIVPGDHRYEENALFVAAAHQAVPALLDEVDRLEAEVAQLQAVFGDLVQDEDRLRMAYERGAREAEERLAGPLHDFWKAAVPALIQDNGFIKADLRDNLVAASRAAQAALEGTK